MQYFGPDSALRHDCRLQLERALWSAKPGQCRGKTSEAPGIYHQRPSGYLARGAGPACKVGARRKYQVPGNCDSGIGECGGRFRGIVQRGEFWEANCEDVTTREPEVSPATGLAARTSLAGMVARFFAAAGDHAHHVLADEVSDGAGREHAQVAVPERAPHQNPTDTAGSDTLIHYL